MIVARHTALSAAASVLAAGGRLLITSIVARRLGPSAFGLLVFTQWCAETVAAFVSLGLPNVLARYCPELAGAAPAARRRRVRELALGAGATLLAGLVLSSAVFTWLEHVQGPFTIALSVGWSLAALSMSLGGALGAGLLRFDLVLASNAAFVAVGLACAFAVTRRGEVADGMLVWLAAGLASALTMGAGLAFSHRPPSGHEAASLSDGREVRRYSLNTWIGSLAASQLWTRGEVGVLRVDVSAAQLAGYGAATTLSGLVMQGVTLFQGGVTPHLARAWSQGDRSRIETLIRSLSHVTFLVALAGGLFVVLFAPELIGTVFGPRFATAATALSIVALAATSAGSGAVNMAVQFATEGRFQRNANLLGAIALIGLTAALAPSLGIVGAAVSRALVLISIAIAMLWSLARAGYGALARSLISRWLTGVAVLAAAAITTFSAHPGVLARVLLFCVGEGVILALFFEPGWLATAEAFPGLGRPLQRARAGVRAMASAWGRP